MYGFYVVLNSFHYNRKLCNLLTYLILIIFLRVNTWFWIYFLSKSDFELLFLNQMVLAMLHRITQVVLYFWVILRAKLLLCFLVYQYERMAKLFKLLKFVE